MDILILTGKFGMGHYSAALSLAARLRREIPEARVEVEDFFSYALPAGSQAAYKCFELLVSRGSGIYNAFYRMTENGRGDALPVYALPLVERMEDLLDARRPQAVIATHPVCAQLVNRCKEEGWYGGAFATCVTDVTAHSEWLTSRCDAYLVGAPQIRDGFLRKGVPSGRVFVTGVPVSSKFQPARRAQGAERHLLVMGGGLGLLPRQREFYHRLDDLPGVKTVVITGGNQRLYHQLAGQYRNITILGYTDRVWEYMAWAHLMLSKPGGVTLFEAIASRLPMLAWEPFLEQERRNAQFLVQAGVGRIAPRDPEACLEAVKSLLFDRRALAEMGRAMEDLQGELAAHDLGAVVGRLESAGVRCG